MFVFMAGARSTGARVARYKADRKSSARPCANFARLLAVAGATSSKSIVDASAMCSMLALAPGANVLVMTGSRVMASNVSGPMNRRALRVITACTRCPRFWSSRATSTDL